MVLREELIELEYIPEDETGKRAGRKREKQRLRRTKQAICIFDQRNALLKAQYVTDKYEIDCFADDRGLEVDVLEEHREYFLLVLPVNLKITKGTYRRHSIYWTTKRIVQLAF